MDRLAFAPQNRVVMRRILLPIPVLLFSLLVAASDTPPRSEIPSPLAFERIDDPGARDALLGRLWGTQRSSKVVGGRVVAVDWGLPAFLIPAAGSLAGGGGTFFRSDVTLVNYADDDQQVLVFWLPRGADGRNQPFFRTTIPEGAPITVRDFVNELGLSGLGALLFVGVLPDTTTPDEDALIHGFSRIWTPQPGSTGTVSQPFSSQNADMMLDEAEAVTIGLQQDGSFRTNAGIVNMGTSTRSFTVNLIGETGTTQFTMTLPPLSMQQTALPAGNWGAVTLIFRPDGDDLDGWAAYGTSVDNVTGDGWVSSASLPY